MSSNKENLSVQRILKLVDENSFMEIGSRITARSTDFNLSAEKAPSDGVVTGYGLVDGCLVFVYSQDASVLNGTIGEMHAKKIASVYDMAMKMGAPVIGLIDCGGVRLQESVDALDAMGLIYSKEVAASGVIPQISAVFGSCGGGLNVVPALSDFTFVEENGKMFINAPAAIKGNKDANADHMTAAFAAEQNGCVDMVGSEDDIIAEIRALVTMLPANNEGDTYTDTCEDDLNRACESMVEMMDDPHYLIGEIADDGIAFEAKRDYAKNMVTSLIRVNGQTVGVIANAAASYDEEGNKTELDNALCACACDKAADMINFCDAFGIPVVTLTNVKGLSTCECSEKKLAKAMARMTAAFAQATCPKLNVVTGQAFGTAYVAMNSKAIGADMVYAYPNAQIGTMDAKVAAKIICPDAAPAELAEKVAEIEKMQNGAAAACARGQVDRIIEPADTRKYVAAALELLYSKSAFAPEKKHGTR